MPFWNRPWWAWLPGGNWIYSADESDHNVPFTGKRILFEAIYPFVVFGALILYTGAVKDTESLNPFDQQKIYKKIKTDKKIAKEEQRQKEEKSNELYHKVFGPSGYADTNFDTGIDFREKVAAYRKMGFKNEILMEGSLFPEPTFEQLEELIEKYNGDD